jgi:hypothetical protein
MTKPALGYRLTGLLIEGFEAAIESEAFENIDELFDELTENVSHLLRGKWRSRDPGRYANLQALHARLNAGAPESGDEEAA